MGDGIFEIERHPDGVIVLRIKSPMVMGLLSDPTKQHLLAAKKELLLALRSMIDSTIEGAEELERKAKSSKIKKTKIEVK